LSRLNPLHELSHPLGKLEQSMGRMERAIGELHTDMAPIDVLHEMNETLKRMEGLMERLVAATEVEGTVSAIKPQPPKSRRAAPRARGA
jgi:hypothetical protein